ncbi:hypothetical protein CDL15_Pgr009749 [Punica granatum]|uniref:Ribose-phosphate pyrophosphokinase 3, mitochondrial n=1 Tax=Punica granatum TaxID=22663 RepID=A0A218WTW2_PUNGR|nr:hypothetical protein CDL15_Pgr009749 [Punica granatum]
MAAAAPPPSSLGTRSSASLRTPSNLLFSKIPSLHSPPPSGCLRLACRSQLRSFDDSQNWITVDYFPSVDPIHVIHGSSSAASIPMAASAGLDSAAKGAKKVCLFYCAETKPLAERVAAQSDYIELRSINWRTFDDGFPNLFIPNAQGIRGQHVAFLASFSSPRVIFEQLSIIYALPKLFVSSFTLVLPFFPTGTSERMEDEGDVATAFTLARILSNVPISRGGPTSLVTFDIHALQERFYFGDNILPCFESGIPLLKNRLQQLPDSDNIVCAKVREGNQRIVRLKEGDPKGRHVVIVDDLVQSGGTLIECQKVLAAHGAAKISAYVTHGIFPHKSWERFKHDNGGNPEDGMTYFWITDSCPQTVNEVMNKPPFEVLSLANSIAASLLI